MAFLVWSDEYSVGNPAIDAQHRGLLDLINELHEAMNSGKGQQALSHVFTSLTEYVEMHFRTEEMLFNLTDYPEKDAHAREHKKLMIDVFELKERFEDGGKFLTLETLNFLKDWILHHIRETDMGYRGYI